MALAANSAQFARSLRAIVEYYADRTKRSATASEALILSNVLRVPGPVLSAICAAIHAHSEISPRDNLPAAQSLWEMEFRETRHIAVCLVRGLEPAELGVIFEGWTVSCDDREVLSWMAEEGMADWWSVSGFDPWRVLRNWMAGDDYRVRHLALLGALYGLESGSSDSLLPKIFQLLKGAVVNLRSDGYSTLIELVQALARRSPQETVRFLLDEIKRGTPGSRRLVRDCSAEFTPNLREELESAL